MRPSNNLENQISLDTYGRVQLERMKVQVHCSSEPPSGLDAFDESSLVTAFLTNLGVTEILYSFRLNLEGKTRKEISESSRLEFLQKLLANRFALSYAKDNTSGLIAKSHKWLRIITIFTF